jgi:uncharacterized protein (TIGR03067 family)
MRKTTIAALALCALAALAGRAADPEPPGGGKAELKKLKGTWTVTKALWNNHGQRAPIGLTYTFDGDKLTCETPQWRAEVVRTTYKVTIDTKKRPHTIELIREGAKSGQVGIYKIEKGELYLTMGLLAKMVPKDFKGDDAPVYVMKREKAKEKGKDKGKAKE